MEVTSYPFSWVVVLLISFWDLSLPLEDTLLGDSLRAFGEFPLLWCCHSFIPITSRLPLYTLLPLHSTWLCQLSRLISRRQSAHRSWWLFRASSHATSSYLFLIRVLRWSYWPQQQASHRVRYQGHRPWQACPQLLQRLFWSLYNCHDDISLLRIHVFLIHALNVDSKLRPTFSVLHPNQLLCTHVKTYLRGQIRWSPLLPLSQLLMLKFIYGLRWSGTQVSQVPLSPISHKPNLLPYVYCNRIFQIVSNSIWNFWSQTPAYNQDVGIT